MKKIIYFLLLIFLFSTKTLAASNCSYEEQRNLEQKASNIKASYEVKEKVMDDVVVESEVLPTYKVFNITILNITEDLYVVVKNDVSNNERTIKYSQVKDGMYTFEWDSLESVTNFTIEVYASDKTKCNGEKYKTLYLSTPRYNEFSKRAICDEMKDFYLCQEFVNFAEVDENTFITKIDKYKTGEVNETGEEVVNKTLTNKMFEFLNEYKYYIGGGIIVILAIVVVIYRNNSKKNRKYGL